MRDHDSEWLIEFSQEYDDGYKVTKRGLDASPMVMKKFDLGRDEVMAFSNLQRANKALTAFHFHPDFPAGDRPGYMRLHEEGHQIAISNGSRQSAQRAQMRRVMEERLSGWGRGLAVGLQTVAIFLSAGGSVTR
ncbi:MAG: hypothetical protein O3A85_12415 [Proteobacteria bacterium]|nr:hypothetical protein [Pseudomonadota bacterium]